MNIYQEKAQELVAKFSAVGLQQRDEGIQCALIHVNDIIQNTIGVGESGIGLSGDDIYSDLEFWEGVKSELETL